MRLHVLLVPHTVATKAASHCAFTQKARLLPRMLRAHGHHITAYGVAGMDVDADERVELMQQDEHLALLGIPSYDAEPTEMIGNRAQTDNACYVQFNHYLRDELKHRLQPEDVICLPFGHAHEQAVKGLDLVDSGEVALIETGIGYPQPMTLTRCYESEAWRHWMLGYEQREGMNWKTPRLEWVVPNYYDLNDWPVIEQVDETARRTVVFLGRLQEVKGLEIVPKLARARPDLTFVLCGQGDPAPYCTEPNVIYKSPIHGVERAAFLGNALCGIYPSRMIEPFCGAAVETMLTGTPVLTSNYGAFTETVLPYTTGIRCGSFPQWLKALADVEMLSRHDVAYTTRSRYSLSTVGNRYAHVFEELAEAREYAKRGAE